MSNSNVKKGVFQHFMRSVTHRFTKRSGPRADSQPPSAEEIQAWLVQKVAGQLGFATEEMQIHEPLADYGLDSRAALSLSGELEDWLGRKLSPTLVWDYPTIAELAAYLAVDEGE